MKGLSGEDFSEEVMWELWSEGWGEDWDCNGENSMCKGPEVRGKHGLPNDLEYVSEGKSFEWKLESLWGARPGSFLNIV